ncbi:MAG TPA: single-stranded DNA-binding protein, partial [Bacteroidales bacterium]|nr:single-stranded DNA-binding protein [Bacteroidales bacterium]
MSLNKVLLIGNVGKDPEVRHLENGSMVARFSLATTEKFKDKNGEF